MTRDKLTGHALSGGPDVEVAFPICCSWLF
jgi:hypothetical protein